MEYQQIISLDLNSNQTYQVVNAKQGDNGRKLKINITENGKKISSGERFNAAVLRIKKPDGKFIMNSCDLVDSSVEITLTENMLSIPGRAYADILLSGAGLEISQNVNNIGAVSTVSFIILIMSVPQAYERVSNDDFSALSNLVDDEVSSALISHYPRINETSGNWETYDASATEETWVDTGISASGREMEYTSATYQFFPYDSGEQSGIIIQPITDEPFKKKVLVKLPYPVGIPPIEDAEVGQVLTYRAGSLGQEDFTEWSSIALPSIEEIETTDIDDIITG